jgi:hypothetical protein
MNKVILMKFTSRERYDILKRCVSEYYKLANNRKDMYWLFTVDFDDPTFNSEDFSFFLFELGVYKYSISRGHSVSKIDAINRGLELVTDLFPSWDILLNISDDQFPIEQGYDDIIRNQMPDDLDASLWFFDSHQTRINTMEILGRKYYDLQGHIYQPEYKSFFCDNEATAVAKHLGKLIFNETCIIKHLHPDWNEKSIHPTTDGLYQRNSKFWEHDEELFNKREACNFFL